jgi:DNA-binding response OmpR family regulator
MTFASTPRTETTGAKTGRRILVVDYNKDFVATIRVLLELNGHYVEVAFDGHAGLEAAIRTEPDVVVLEVGLPKLNGYELCHRIRGQRLARQPIIICATGWAQLIDRELEQYAGFDAHLVKPFVYEELSTLLESARVRS